VPDTTIKVMLNISNPTIQVGDRVWLDCIVVGDVGAKIDFSKSGMDGLPENAQVINTNQYCPVILPTVTDTDISPGGRVREMPSQPGHTVHKREPVWSVGCGSVCWKCNL